MRDEGAVLLVEDSADDVAATLAAVRQLRFPHRVDVARDGLEALDYLMGTGAWAGQGRAVPLLIILDLSLPRLGGLELLRRIRRDPKLRPVVVIVLTGSEEESARLEAKELGASFYFRKPEGLEATLENVRRIADLLPAP